MDVVGTSSEFSLDTFRKAEMVTIDPNSVGLRWTPATRVAVSIKRGEQFAEVERLRRSAEGIQKALEVNRNSSLAHYRVGEVFFLQNNDQSGRHRIPRSAERRSGSEMDRGVGAHSPRHDLRSARPARSRGERIQSRDPHQGQHAKRTGRSSEIFESALRAETQ